MSAAGDPTPSSPRRSESSALLLLVIVVALLVALGAGYLIRATQSDTETVTVSQQQAAENERRSITAAPAFSADELAADPEEAWLTNGGSLANTRYSPLDEIDTSNVGDLKGVWMTDLEGQGTAAKYSAEGQPIVYDGVIYIPTGDDDVFAVGVESGQILWHYDSGIDQTINTVCCGWLSRGVALGDGKVYIGQLDGSLVALDQRTGDVAWKTQVGRWQEGYTITSAPLYYDGLVYTGVSGGEFSIRGYVTAYDAETGEQVWRFHTTPGPGEQGHDSWPQSGTAWRNGGAPVWQTPALDPELGLLYFSTGNASPDLDGSDRAGDNLYAASIVAVDAKSGEYRWHFQQVHHDIWDYDAPSPVVLFDGEFDGEERKALAETGKTGWTYVLDRETGEPLLPVEEERVPQDELQKTSPTQPIPQYPPFTPHEFSDQELQEVRRLAEKSSTEKTPPRVVRGDIYTPFQQEVRVISPGPQGGVNWQPTSYNPETGLIYICGMRSVSGYTRSGVKLPEGKFGEVTNLGSVFTTTGFGLQEGHFGAWNPTTGEVEWRKQWPESCYSGTVTTGGNLVFVGRNDGRLQAYDAEGGEQLWSFQTGAGANSTVTVFEHEGTQYVAFLAGGNSLAATAHGDNLWLFSLDGTMGPAEAGGAGEGGEHAGQDSGEQEGEGRAGENPATPPAAADEPDAAAGEAVFLGNCTSCHGTNGLGGNGGPTLANADNLEQAVARVTNGGNGMPAFKGTLSTEQINDVSAYVTERVASGG